MLLTYTPMMALRWGLFFGNMHNTPLGQSAFQGWPLLFLSLVVVPVFEHFEHLITTGRDTEFDPTLKWEINCIHSRQPELPLQGPGILWTLLMFCCRLQIHLCDNSYHRSMGGCSLPLQQQGSVLSQADMKIRHKMCV